MNYFETGVELFIAVSVNIARIVSVGEAPWGEVVDRGLRRHIDSGIGCGESPVGGGHRLPLCAHHRRAWVTVFRNGANG